MLWMTLFNVHLALAAKSHQFELNGSLEESSEVVKAVDQDQVKAVYDWLKKGNSPYQRINNKLKESLLDRAAQRGSFKTATLLLRIYRYDSIYGSPQLKIIDGRGTPLMVTLAALAYPQQSKSKNYEKLVARMARLFPHLLNDADQAYLGDGRTALHQVAANGNLRLAEILVKRGARVNVVNKEAETPLHLAAQFGHLSVVEFLVKNDPQIMATINAVSKHTRSTPLMLAAENGHEQVMEFLVKRGAKKELKNAFGKTSNDLYTEFLKQSNKSHQRSQRLDTPSKK